MKKSIYIILSLIAIVILSSSCNKRKTYADLLKEENKAIDKFISKNKLVVIDNFPRNGVFKDNEFFRDPATGVYYNIMEVGDTINTKKAKDGSEVHVRFKGLKYFSKNDTLEYNNNDPIRSPFPETFVYRGPVTMLNRSRNYPGTTAGWAVPLEHVGRNGKVRMIIPFNMGAPSDQQAYTPTYYDVVHYTGIDE